MAAVLSIETGNYNTSISAVSDNKILSGKLASDC